MGESKIYGLKGLCMQRLGRSVADLSELLRDFSVKNELSETQQKQFEDYVRLLIEWNKVMNLTALQDPKKIMSDHFADSLAVDAFIDIHSLNMIADVGTGAGFPGIPLKIKYPHLKVVLIEVITKKIRFLETVIKQLELPDVEIVALDWRTFLRNTKYPIDLFVTRAALQPAELVRMFSSSSPYACSQLIYWASILWKPESKETQYIEKEVEYQIAGKRRKLIFLKKGGCSD
jgi:16S rRNA (guanine527-N7)-methyltransferase